MSNRQEKLAQVEAILTDLIAKSKSEAVATEEVVAKSDPVADVPAPASDPQGLDDIKTGTETSIGANGGEDVIKNKDKKDAKAEKMNKEDDSEDEEDDEDEDDAKKAKKKMKKSLSDDEVAISKEDFELLKLAKSAKEAEEAEKLAKSNPMYKGIEALTDMVKSLREDIDAMKSAPAREPKSLTSYDAIAKGGSDKKIEDKALVKSKVLDVMQNLLSKGLCTSDHVCEYEISGKLSDPAIRDLVKAEVNKN